MSDVSTSNDDSTVQSNVDMRKKYNDRYYLKHKSEPSTTCTLCGGKFNRFNHSHHIKTKKHLNAIVV
jgi:hypothetical protein